ncbi:hypothetical protein [Mycolicibacterium aichiense]|uniref:hypothetical protein n=1 Tax=Mycolicibacterium aichiense TaxID=1799 RepID=UPI001E35DA49|nr:hypothetical protein [Mycolicibacterium aichiense]
MAPDTSGGCRDRVVPQSSIPAADTPLVDGSELLSELLDTLRRYVCFPDDNCAVAVALWVAATHAIDAWNAAPRLVLNSPQKRCGKSRALDVISGMCHQPLVTVNASVSAVFRSLYGDRPPTLIIDEADTIFGSKRSAENNEDLRACLTLGISATGPHCVALVRIWFRPSSPRSPWWRWPASARCRTRSPTGRSISRCAAERAASG